jgi:hypothetical protein
MDRMKTGFKVNTGFGVPDLEATVPRDNDFLDARSCTTSDHYPVHPANPVIL